MSWLLLILSLPTENATARMRAWRALKSCGAAVLRDGVYLLPAIGPNAATLELIADDLRQNGGTARMLRVADEAGDFASLFERSAEYGALLGELASARNSLAGDTALEVLRQSRKLRRSFEQLVAIDFFPGEAQQQAGAALEALDSATRRVLSPDEPHPVEVGIEVLDRRDFQGRVWATRERPWVDRLACAWLIRRFIDPLARFVWLKPQGSCPKDALGFDFDGARFSHTPNRVSVETLLASFGLETPALRRLGLLVHGLDAGGVLPPESAGVERVLAGMREAIADDDLLLQVAASVFDGLFTAFESEVKA